MGPGGEQARKAGAGSDQWPTATTRREFVKGIGGALGGALLLGGSGGRSAFGRGMSGAPLLPSGYIFYRVYTLGDDVFPFAPLTAITPGVMFSDSAQIIFHGNNAAGERGVYALAMDFTGPVPRVTGGNKIVEHGDILADGRLVDRIAAGDTNAAGSYATVISTANPGNVLGPPPNPTPTAPPITAPGLYIRTPSNGGLVSLAQFTDPTPGLAGGEFSALFGDVALQDDDTTHLVASYALPRLSATQGPAIQQGLFSFAQGKASTGGTLVVSTGELLPQSSAIIRSLGLIDVARDGNYVAQAHAQELRHVLSRRGDTASGPPQASVLLNGNVHQPVSQARLLAAEGGLAQTASVVEGQTVIGPRVGPGNVVAHVVHTPSGGHQLMRFAGQQSSRLRQTGELGGNAVPVRAIGGPVVSSTGLTFHVQFTEDAVNELWVTNGIDHRLLLSSLDGLRPSGAITEILHGYHPRQVDSAGRMAFTGEFLINPGGDRFDPANIGTAIIVGIPY